MRASVLFKGTVLSSDFESCPVLFLNTCNYKTMCLFALLKYEVGWPCVTKSNTYKTNSTIEMQPNIFFKDVSCLLPWSHYVTYLFKM